MHRLSERSTQPIDLAVAGRARQRRRSQWYFFTTSHGLEGEFLPCALALAKRRQWRGYDAVKLAAACGIPGPETGLPGGVANTASYPKTIHAVVLIFEQRHGFL